MRTSSLTPAVADVLAQLWPTSTTTQEIGARFGVTGSCVTRWARHLGLPPKYQPRRDRVARELEARRRRREREQWEQAERLTITVEIPEEPPVCFVCGARSSDWDGHPACRGRGRKAA